jgi:hypothetical protein
MKPKKGGVMNYRKITRLAIIVIVCIALSSMFIKGYTESSAKQNDIRSLLNLTGASERGMQVMNHMVAIYKQSNPGVAHKFWDEFMAEIDSNELVEMIVPIYDKYLTHDDIKGLIEFFETPVGRKFIQVQPKIMQESMIVGQQWGQQIGQKVTRKLKEQGY